MTTKITKDNYDDLIQDMEKMSFDMSTLIDDISYIGFDIYTVIGSMTKKEVNKEAFKKDISVLITIALSRGTKIKKMVVKMSDVGKKLVEDLKKKYEIKDTVPKSATDVTLGRVLACFPTVAATILHKNAEINLVGEGGIIDRRLMFPGSVAIIPKSFDLLIARYKRWSETFSEVIGADKSQVALYSKIIQDNNYYTEDSRIEIMKTLNIRNE